MLTTGNLEGNLSRQRAEPLQPEELERSRVWGEAGGTEGEGWASGWKSLHTDFIQHEGEV